MRGSFFGGMLCLFLLVGALGFVLDPYALFVLNRLVIYAILCLGLNVLIGYAGQFAFAHAAMYGIGAYVTGLLQVRLGWPFLPSAVLGAVVATSVGALLTLPALRLSGLYLALSTLAFAIAVQWVFLNWTEVTFGAGGFRAPGLELGMGLDQGQSVFVVTVVVAFLLVIGLDGLLRSRYGRRFVAIRDNPTAAASLGVNVTGTKVLAFAVSAFYAGVAGALSVPLLRFVAPESFDLNQMVLQQIMIVVGGLGSIAGSLIGAAVVVVALELLRDTKGLLEIFFGAVLIGFVLFQPRGLVQLLQRALRFREPYFPRRLLASRQTASKPHGTA